METLLPVISCMNVLVLNIHRGVPRRPSLQNYSLNCSMPTVNSGAQANGHVTARSRPVSNRQKNGFCRRHLFLRSLSHPAWRMYAISCCIESRYGADKWAGEHTAATGGTTRGCCHCRVPPPLRQQQGPTQLDTASADRSER